MTASSKIHPSLQSLAVDVASLTPDPRNARLHDERNLREVVASYREHGQRKPIVVQRCADDGTAMVVRAGNGQLAAAKQLGWSEIAAVVIDENDRDAIRYALRDNRTAELAEWDYEVLASEAARFEHLGDDLADVGWTHEELLPLRETTWFSDAKGTLEEHTRTFGGTGTKEGVDVVTVRGEDAKAFQEAAAVMREKFNEGDMNLGKVVGRLARHYLATLTHSAAVKP